MVQSWPPASGCNSPPPDTPRGLAPWLLPKEPEGLHRAAPLLPASHPPCPHPGPDAGHAGSEADCGDSLRNKAALLFFYGCGFAAAGAPPCQLGPYGAPEKGPGRAPGPQPKSACVFSSPNWLGLSQGQGKCCAGRLGLHTGAPCRPPPCTWPLLMGKGKQSWLWGKRGVGGVMHTCTHTGAHMCMHTDARVHAHAAGRSSPARCVCSLHVDAFRD